MYVYIYIFDIYLKSIFGINNSHREFSTSSLFLLMLIYSHIYICARARACVCFFKNFQNPICRFVFFQKECNLKSQIYLIDTKLLCFLFDIYSLKFCIKMLLNQTIFFSFIQQDYNFSENLTFLFRGKINMTDFA